MTEQNYIFNIPTGLKERIQQHLTDKGLFQIAKKTGLPTKDSINLLYKYLFIPHIIVEELKTNRGIYEKEGYQLNAKNMYNNILAIKGSELKIIINYLLDSEVIILYSSEINHGKGSKDNKCRCYKLQPDLENSIEFYQPDINSTFIKKLTKGDCFTKHMKQEVAPFSENELQAIEHQKDMFKNYVGFSDELIKYYTSFYSCSFEDLKSGKVAVKTSHLPIISLLRGEPKVSRPDELSRLYSPLTSLKKEYKPHLTLAGKELIGLDIVNSQLLFSVIALEEYEKVNSLNFTSNADFQFYKECCQKGLVYETLAKQTGLTEMLGKNRKMFKQLLYQRFFFSKVSKNLNKVQLGFKELFPTVYKLINEIKTEKKYNEWALMLQRVESQVVIDCAVSQLIDDGMKILTLHDGLYVSNEQDYQTAKSKLEECFNGCGITASIKREVLVKTDLSNLDKKSENELWFEEMIGGELSNHWFKIGDITMNVRNLTRKPKNEKSKKLSRKQFLELYNELKNKQTMNEKNQTGKQTTFELLNRLRERLKSGGNTVTPIEPAPLTEQEENEYEKYLIQNAIEEESIINSMFPPFNVDTEEQKKENNESWLNENTVLDVIPGLLEYQLGNVLINIKTLEVYNIENRKSKFLKSVEELKPIINKYFEETYGIVAF